MKLFKDIFTDKDLFTDAFKYTLQDDILYVVEGKMVTEDHSVDDASIGGNKTAEADDFIDDQGNTSIVFNVVSSNNLEEAVQEYTANEYKKIVKNYFAKLIGNLKDKGTEEASQRVEFLKEKMQPCVQDLCSKIRDGKVKFYCGAGDAYELDGMVVLQACKEDGTPCLMVWKDGVYKETV